MASESDKNEGNTSESQEVAGKSSEGNGKIHMVPLYKLFSFADSTDCFLMVAGSIGAVANGLSMPLMTMIMGELLDSFGHNQNNHHQVLHAVSKVCLKFVYLAMGAAIAAFTQETCWKITGERQAARIRSLYLKTILRQDVSFFDVETNTGEVVGRMSGDTVLIQDALGEKVGRFIQLGSTFFGGFMIAFSKGWLLTLIMLSSIPPLVIVGAVLAITISKMTSREQSAYAKATIIVEQTISSIKTVASFTGEKLAINRYNECLESAYKSGVFEGFAEGVGLGMFMIVFFCSYALALWFGGKMIVEKHYTGGRVINVITSVLTGSMSLGHASPYMSALAAGQVAAYKMFETINRKPTIDSSDKRGRILKTIRGDIELKKVYFSYPARPDEQILRQFSLFIPSGTRTALVGQSGSGKSTVLSLIERFYDPQRGEVLIDGVNLKEFQVKWIRAKIGLVSQEPVLFSGSIKENIAYGKEDASLEDIKVAIELANAAKFIDKLPQGLDTMVGEHGAQLSGGQKQRVAIARAIIKDPQILLLDEATSALDTESERKVQEALDRIMVNRTTIIVAHRLSTVRNADTIAVIHRGKVIEKGSHAELVRDPNGAYFQLIHLQEERKESVYVPERKRRSDIAPVPVWGSSGLGSTSFSSAATDIEKTGKAPSASPQRQPPVQLGRLIALNKPEIPILLLGAVVAAINGLVFPAFGALLAKVAKTFYEPANELKKDTRFWALIFVALGTVSLLIYPVRSYLFAVAGCKLIQRIRSLCFQKVVHMDIAWFDEPAHSTGSIGARLSVDAAIVRGLVGEALGLLIQNIATTVFGLVIAFTASWQLTLIILALIPLIGINGFIQMKFMMKGASADAKGMYEEASQVANDAVGNIRTVASFCAEEKVMQIYKKKCEGPLKSGIRQGLISGVGSGLAMLLLFSVYATGFYAGAQLVAHGNIKFSDVYQVFLTLAISAMAIAQSSALCPDFGKAKTAASSIFAIIDTKSKIDSSDESGGILDKVQGNIRFHNVSFKYPLRPNVQIFRDFSLSVNAGKTVALVGESGSGKSTIVSLLQRFYNPNSGSITLDGVEIQTLQLKWFRRLIGLVSQEPVLFNDTIRANIAFGREGYAFEAEVLAAAKLANAHMFISGLQQGYDALVGERGLQLSGGQKQRIAIARALIRNPKLLLLDEATSALDAESESVVQDALDRIMVNRTTIVVAHRLSTIKNADVIAVLKNGVIVEKGKHKTLINIDNGFYANLVSLHHTTTSAL